MSRRDPDLNELFRRDLDDIELPPPGRWERRPRPMQVSRWRSLLAVPALIGAVALGLVLAVLLNAVRNPQVATPPSSASPSSSAIASSSPGASRSAVPSPTLSPATVIQGVQMHATLPPTGQWALILTRTYDQTPTDPSQGSGPKRGPLTETISAVPLSARATTGRDTIELLSYTGSISSSPAAQNLLREQISPDGRRLVLSVIVTDRPPARLALFVVDLAAGTARPLTSDTRYDETSAAWSPSGDEIALSRCTFAAGGACTDAGIWVVRADGIGTRQVLPADTSSPGSTTVFGWNGDGTAIAYARGFEGSRYYLLDVASGRTSAVSARSPLERGAADWRDARPAFVAALAEGPRGGRQFIEVAEDQTGSNPRDVVVGTATDGNTFFHQARWRPGTNDILYVRSHSDPTVVARTLFVSDSVGTTPREIKTVSYAAFFATWTPDGRDILYLEGLGIAGTLHLVAPDGTNDRVVAAWGGIPESAKDWVDLAAVGY